MEEEQQEAPKGADQPDIRDDTLDTEEMKKLFVGGIVNDSTEDELKEFFEGLCCDCEIKVTDAVVIKKEGSEKKAHFGFVTFACSEMIDEVLLKRKELSFKGRTMDVNRAVPKDHNNPGAHERTKKLFIANLPKFNCTEEELKKYFDDRHPKKYGVIDSVQLIKKKGENGEKLEENKGYGFIMVSCEDLADKMAIQHNSFEFGGRRIELKKSVPSSEGGGQKRGGRGRGGQRGDAFAYGGGYGGGYPPYGGGWDGYGYGAFDYGYGGYGADPYAYAGQQQQGGRGGRGGRGGARYAPY